MVLRAYADNSVSRTVNPSETMSREIHEVSSLEIIDHFVHNIVLHQSQQVISHSIRELNPHERQLVLASLGRDTYRQLLNLSQEPSRRIFLRDFQRLARQWEQNQDLSLAQLAYETIATLDPEQNQGRQAQDRLEILTGGGSFIGRFDFLARRFMPQVMDLGLLLGMGIGLRTFRGVSSGVTSLLGNRHFATQALSWGLGFTAETSSFVLVARSIHDLQGQRVSWELNTLAQEFRHTGLSLLALKGFGALGQWGGKSALQLFNHRASPWLNLAQSGLPQFSMLTGIMGARALETQLDWTPSQSPDLFLLESLVTLLHFNVAGRMLGQVPGMHSGPRLAHPEASAKIFPFELEVRQTATGIRFPNIVLSTGGNGSKSSTPPAPRPNRASNYERPYSDVQATKLNPLHPLRRILSGAEGPLLLQYNSSTPQSNWLETSLKVNVEILREVTKQTREIAARYSASDLLPPLRTISTGAQRVQELLETLDQQQRRSPTSISNADIQRFTFDYYRFSSSLGNSIDNPSLSYQSAFEHLNSARKILDGMLSPTVTGRLFSEANNLAYIETLHNLSRRAIKLYARPGENRWETNAAQLISELQPIIEQTKQALSPEHANRLYLEDVRSVDTDLKSIKLLLDQSAQSLAIVGQSSTARNFFQNFYNVPYGFGEFLRTGEIEGLRSASENARISHRILSE